MAKKVKKTSSKVTKEDLVAQNEALGEQVAGLQEEVMDLVEENEELNDIFDEQDDYIFELEDRNDALQNSLVREQFEVQDLCDILDERDRKDELVFSGLGLVLSEAQKLVAERNELAQGNHHLTIQLAAAKDRRLRIEAELFTLRLEHSAYRIRAFSGETYNSTTGKYSI